MSDASALVRDSRRHASRPGDGDPQHLFERIVRDQGLVRTLVTLTRVPRSCDGLLVVRGRLAHRTACGNSPLKSNRFIRGAVLSSIGLHWPGVSARSPQPGTHPPSAEQTHRKHQQHCGHRERCAQPGVHADKLRRSQDHNNLEHHQHPHNHREKKNGEQARQHCEVIIGEPHTLVRTAFRAKVAVAVPGDSSVAPDVWASRLY